MVIEGLLMEVIDDWTLNRHDSAVSAVSALNLDGRCEGLCE
jgi:hypothetical protein